MVLSLLVVLYLALNSYVSRVLQSACISSYNAALDLAIEQAAFIIVILATIVAVKLRLLKAVLAILFLTILLVGIVADQLLFHDPAGRAAAYDVPRYPRASSWVIRDYVNWPDDARKYVDIQFMTNDSTEKVFAYYKTVFFLLGYEPTREQRARNQGSIVFHKSGAPTGIGLETNVSKVEKSTCLSNYRFSM